MNTKQRAIAICFLAVSLLVVSMTISSCGSGQLFGPMLTPTPPFTPTPIPTLGIGSTQVSPVDGMILLYVPEGEFLMGAADSDPAATRAEKPQHTVYLDAFWIDQTEVTSAMYAKCVAGGKCKPRKCLTGSKYDQHPAVCVDWFNAEAYCEWAGRRLPTEAEWEKAARGTDGRLYPWGNEPPTCEYAIMDDGSGYGCGERDTAVALVGSKPKGASPYGALDMAGNVWEWVNDWYDPKYYSTSSYRNPTGPASGYGPVLRGGAWNAKADRVRVAYRISHSNNPTGGDSGIGFRCSASPGP
jgi:formylglycine-generating enzyme required for sulfatase activity